MTSKLQINSLKLPGDMRQRMATPHVRSRARSIAEHGMLHPPIVRRENWEVIAGCDRIAACMLLGWESVECDVRDLTADDAAVFARIDNADRRHDPEEQRREVAQLEEAIRRRLERQGLPEGAKSVEAVVRREVAAETGVAEETLRKRQQRARKAHSTPPGAGLELPSGFDASTLPDDDTNDLRATVCKAANVLDAAGRQVRAAINELKAAQKASVQLPRIGRLFEALDAAAHALRSVRPARTCPYCKDECNGCDGCDSRGWLGEGEAKLLGSDDSDLGL